MAPWVLHVDLDQFIAAVEVLRRPELRGLPVVVGGRGDPTERGVVSTASYEARAFGVHSGTPLRTAARRCPDAVFLPVDREVYEAASAKVMAALRTFDAVVEVFGWDEAFLAVTTDEPWTVARRIQERVLEATGLVCTVGIGQNKVQAKLATGFGKPAGVFCLTDHTWLTQLGERPTDALWGIGAKTAKRLRELGITTVAELAAADSVTLAGQFGPVIGPWLVRLGSGQDRSRVVAEPWVPRSRSREVTFQQDLTSWDDVGLQVERVALAVAGDAAKAGQTVSRIIVKVRFAPYLTQTRRRTVDPPTADGPTLATAAAAALEQFTQRRPVRLVGVAGEFTRPGRR